LSYDAAADRRGRYSITSHKARTGDRFTVALSQLPVVTLSLSKMMIYGIMVFLPWGKMMRFWVDPDGEARGITTLLAVCLIGLNSISGNIFRTLMQIPSTLFFVGFLLLSALAALGIEDPELSVRYAMLLAVYFSVTLSVAAIQLSERDLERILKIFVVSSGLMCIAAIIDYAGIINFPIINEDYSTFYAEGFGDLKYVTGTFHSRTQLNNFIVIVLGAALGFVFVEKKFFPNRLLWLIGTFIIFCTAMLSFSRAIILVCVALVMYLFLISKPSVKVLRKTLFVSVLLAAGFLILIHTYYPTVWSGLNTTLPIMTPQKISTNPKDMIRVTAFRQSLADITDSPLGVGYARIEIEGLGKVNVHNNLTLLLRAGGPIGLLLVFLFVFPILIKGAGLMPLSKLEIPLMSALLGWGIYGLMHNTISSLLFWIFLGLMLGRFASHRPDEFAQQTS